MKIVKPLISMLASLIMCVILSACQSSKASPKYIETLSSTDHSSSLLQSGNHQIRILHDSENKNYIVNGKRFSFQQLSSEQKKRILELEAKLDKLEQSLTIDEERLETWSEKMELIAEQMEQEAEEFEDTFDDFDFEQGSRELEQVSLKIAKASRNLEDKMRQLEKSMRALQVEMPQINQQAISQLEVVAENMERILVEIAEEI
jgi:uncharacterized lipoprotein YehR (DUF1307 family)